MKYDDLCQRFELWYQRVVDLDLLRFPEPDDREYWHGIFDTVTQQWFDRLQLHLGERPEPGTLQGLWLDAWVLHDSDDFIEGRFAFYDWGLDLLHELTMNWNDGPVALFAEDEFYSLSGDCETCTAKRDWYQWRRRLRVFSFEEPLPTKGHRPVRRGHANPRERAQSRLSLSQLFEDDDDWEEKLRGIKIRAWAPVAETLPYLARTPTSEVYIIAHLFPGRRRKDDVHDWLHRIADEQGVQVLVLSLDTAVHPVLGNLHPDSAAWRLFETLLLDGYICGLIAGSPCETFSEARFTSLPGGKGPRPLRSAVRLWGLAELRLRELAQLRLGSSFQLQVLWSLLQLRRTGGVGVSEHPAPPRDPERPTIWRSTLVKLLLSDCSFELHSFAQYLYGAPAVKPTGFLALALPDFRREMKAWQKDYAKPTFAAIGVDEDGNFRTSALKEYPGQLCGALASAVIKAIVRARRARRVRLVAPPERLEEWLTKVAEASATIKDGSTWLPDFQG